MHVLDRVNAYAATRRAIAYRVLRKPLVILTISNLHGDITVLKFLGICVFTNLERAWVIDLIAISQIGSSNAS